MTVVHDTKGYLEDAYLDDGSYLTAHVQGSMGFQAEFVTEGAHKDTGQQANFTIRDYLESIGFQADFTIKDDNPIGMQVTFGVSGFTDPNGQQANFTIKADTGYGQQANFTIETETPEGMQTAFTLETETPEGMQALFESVFAVGMQMLSTIYNTTNLRVLCDFPSRGTEALGGNNWVANSTEPGDFLPANLNTDIEEEVWRSESGVDTGINLDCDTGLPQGVFLDTFAALGSNITRSANVKLYGSNDPTFTAIGVTITLQPLENGRIFWVSEDLPLSGYRYWRLSIDDPTNPDEFVKIGSILFGASQIFSGECFVDEVNYQLRDFADVVETEGFTNVANSRAQRRNLQLEFRFLDFNKANFDILRGIFQTQRTVLKCLWIPTPDPDEPAVMDRFAVFSKLTQIPSERHKAISADYDYVSFTIELDESK